MDIFLSSFSIFFRVKRSVASCSNLSFSKSLTAVRISSSFLSRAEKFSNKFVEQFSKWVSASFNSPFITSMRSLMIARRLLKSCIVPASTFMSIMVFFFCLRSSNSFWSICLCCFLKTTCLFRGFISNSSRWV